MTYVVRSLHKQGAVILRHPFVMVLAALVIVCTWYALLFLPRVEHVDAESVSFYATSCLGGWQHSNNVVGAPDAIVNGEEQYSSENSAILSDTIAQIFCGGFVGELPENALHKKIVLNFSWKKEDILFDTAVPPETPAEADSLLVEEPLLPVPETVIEEIPAEEPLGIDEVVPDSSAIELPVEELLPVQEEQVPVVESIPVDDIPTPELSFFMKPFVSVAYAQEDTFAFEVLYTIDGQEWRSLGYVGDINNTVTFDLPIDVFSSVADLALVQIALHPLQTFDTVPTVYLDSLWLEVLYDVEQQDEIDPVLSQEVDTMLDDEIPVEEVEQEIIEEQEQEELPVFEEPLPILSVRHFEKTVDIDKHAGHSCRAEQFRIDVSNQEFVETRLIITNSKAFVSGELEIGSLPDGIDIRFSESGDYVYHVAPNDTEVGISMVTQVGAQKGDFTIPIFYTQRGDLDSSVVCQINIVN